MFSYIWHIVITAERVVKVVCFRTELHYITFVTLATARAALSNCSHKFESSRFKAINLVHKRCRNVSNVGLYFIKTLKVLYFHKEIA